jgi:FkbM family methyltransferase
VIKDVPFWAFTRAIALAHRRFEAELGGVDTLLSGTRRRTALDVGAWYGPWSIALARRFDRVVAFEPNPVVAGRLRPVLPSNVTLVPAAASDVAGTASLHAPEALGAEGVGAIGPKTEKTVEVETVTIDSLGLDDLDFIKVDVEGHEHQALVGGLSTIERNRPTLLVELEARHGPVRPVFELLGPLGYEAFVLKAGTLVPTDATTYTGPSGRPRSYISTVVRPERDRSPNNVLFIPRDH